MLPVPPLLLQPLVENSIRHGLEPKVEGGEIVVTRPREAGQPGDRGERHRRGLGAAPPSEGSSFGLEQVRDRLATMYGDRGHMKLAPSPSGGARATLRFPTPA